MPAPQCDVIVVGAINVDLVVVAASLPGPGETVVGALSQHGGGKGANAAVAAARSGARVRLIGAVGDDANGIAALAELARDVVDVEEVARLGDTPTGVALIVVDARGENQIAVGAGANGALAAEHVTAALARLLPSAGCVLVSTEIPGAAVVAAVQAVTEAGVPCILNPAPVIPEVAGLLGNGTVLTPNVAEARGLAVLTAGAVAGEPIGELAARLAVRSGSPVVVTLGGQGALVVDPAGGTTTVPPLPVDVVDTTGAGDTFNGVLAAGIAAGLDFLDAVRRAGVAAGLSVTGAGARGGMPDRARLDAALAADAVLRGA